MTRYFRSRASCRVFGRESEEPSGFLSARRRVKEVAILVGRFSLGSFDTVMSSSSGNDQDRGGFGAGETAHARIDSS